MKNLLIILSIVLLYIACENSEDTADFGDSDSFTVSGTIKGLDGTHISSYLLGLNDEAVRDSIPVKNGSFTYTAKVAAVTAVRFWPNVERTVKRSKSGGYYPALSSTFKFLAGPGDEILLEGEITDFVNAYPTGTKANDDLAELHRMVYPLMNKSVNKLLLKEKLEEKSEEALVLEKEMESLENEVLEIKKTFIKKHPASQASAYYVEDMMLRGDLVDEEAIQLFTILDADALADIPFYKAALQRTKGIETTLVGKSFPNFVSDETPTGETFDFSSLKGKYVLIDFWGTWCGPCVAEMPKVKQYKDKYQKDLVVLGVNYGDTMEDMNDFLSEKGYDWQQVLAGRGERSLSNKYNVVGYPTKFIISPEGIILHRFVGDSEEAFQVLDQLL